MAPAPSPHTFHQVLRPKLNPYLMRAVPLGLLAIFLISRSPESRTIGIFLGVFLAFEAICLLTSSITLTMDGFTYRSMNRITSHRWADIDQFVLVEHRMFFGLIPVNRFLGWNFSPNYKTNKLLAAARLITRAFKTADAMVRPVGFRVPMLVGVMNQFLDISRNTALATEYAEQARAIGELPTIVVSRRARQFGASWQDARSWLGGKPRLGPIPWPRDKKGVPLTFIAQLDLAEIAAIAPNTPLPSTGSLAFFIGDHPIVYVPTQAGSPFTAPPADAPSLVDAGYGGSGVCCWPGDPRAPKSFPFWPVDFNILGTFPPVDRTDEDEADELEEARFAAQLSAMDQRFKRRQATFTAREAFALLGDIDRPCWWHSAIHFADCLRVALEFGVPQRLKVLQASPLGSAPASRRSVEFESRLPEFRSFVAETLRWTQDRDPWMLMESVDTQRLQSIIERTQAQFSELARWQTPRTYEELATVTLLALATAEDRAYATMPSTIRRLINERYLLPIDHWHQIFGDPLDIQGNAVAENQGKLLLLRLTYDDMMHWSFGDNGAYHFFIDLDNLSVQNWNAATMTFECH